MYVLQRPVEMATESGRSGAYYDRQLPTQSSQLTSESKVSLIAT
jgi:hypothetical protein